MIVAVIGIVFNPLEEQDAVCVTAAVETVDAGVYFVDIHVSEYVEHAPSRHFETSTT